MKVKTINNCIGKYNGELVIFTLDHEKGTIKFGDIVLPRNKWHLMKSAGD